MAEADKDGRVTQMVSDLHATTTMALVEHARAAAADFDREMAKVKAVIDSGPSNLAALRLAAAAATATAAAALLRRTPLFTPGTPDNHARKCWRCPCNWHGVGCHTDGCPCSSSWVDPDVLARLRGGARNA